MQRLVQFSKRFVIKISIYIILIFFIAILSKNPLFIEKYYSSGLYPYIAILFRFLFGWLPFSIGDLVYLVVILFILRISVRTIKKIFGRKYNKRIILSNIGKWIERLVLVYILFYLLWGLNYFRLGIANQLDLKRANYTTIELKSLTQELAIKSNFYRKNISLDSFQVGGNNRHFSEESQNAYRELSKSFPFLEYKVKSIKPSIFGVMGNYLGYTGYYNPFTGEAQVNMHTPSVMLPAIYCHEMAHQLGYATEDEANFVGYLAASHSKEKEFLYSIYVDLFQYAASELYVRDSSQYLDIRKSLDTLVKKDLKDIRMFYRPYHTKIDKVISLVYGQYLKVNNQPQGIDTYSDVISLLIAYRKKYKTI